MLLMFELFREAGLRLPSVIGGTISVVGGLIIGDAAIRAGVTSPEMIVVIAISTIASFTLVNQSLVTTISILRIAFILASAFFGLFGFFISLYFTLLYLCNIRIYGYSYMNLATDLNWTTIKNRSSAYHQKATPSVIKHLHPKITLVHLKAVRSNEEKIIIILSSLATSLLLSGCWDVNEAQRMYYVDGLGIDYKDGQYVIYMQLINFINVAKSEYPYPQTVQAEVGQSKGKTMEEELYKLFQSVDQKVFWGI